MSKDPETNSIRLRTFVPQLKERKDRFVYGGRIGQIGATPSSRYRLVGTAAFFALVLLLTTSMIHPLLSLAATLFLVAMLAGGWPAATGVAELRHVRRIYSHSAIILLSGGVSAATAFFAPGVERLGFLPAIAAVGIVASFMVELVRGEAAEGRLESVISCISGVLAAISAAGWVGMARLYQSSHDDFLILILGLGLALAIATFGIRLISAGPKEGPRRGAVTLGVTPVAFVGVIGYVIAILLTPVVG